MLKPSGILEACLYAPDLNAAENFYREVLGLEVYSRDPGRDVFFRCGQGMFLIFNPAQTSRNGDSDDGGCFERRRALASFAFGTFPAELETPRGSFPIGSAEP